MGYNKVANHRLTLVITMFLVLLWTSVDTIESVAEELANIYMGGNAEEQFQRGVRYMKGLGVPQDNHMAFEWFKKSADQGLASAQINVGWCYEQGLGIEQSDRQAAEWYQKSARQGNIYAMNNIAMLLSTGRGVAKDCPAAAIHLRQAAESGYPLAQANMGNFYREGCGVEKDTVKAVQWTEIAALNGDSGAQANLGSYYANGEGTPRNYQEAYFWSLLAARQGQQGAIRNISTIRYNLTPAQIAMAEQQAAAFSPRSVEEQQFQIDITEFTISPESVPAGGEFELIVRFLAADPRVPYETIQVTFRYELLLDGKVLFASKEKTIESPNNQQILATKRSMQATKKPGRYTMQIYLKQGREKEHISTKDFVIR